MGKLDSGSQKFWEFFQIKSHKLWENWIQDPINFGKFGKKIP